MAEHGMNGVEEECGIKLELLAARDDVQMEMLLACPTRFWATAQRTGRGGEAINLMGVR